MLRVAHLIQSVDDRSGGTSTAFLQIMGALRERAGIDAVAYTLRPPAGDVAAEAIAREPERWRLAGSLGRLGPGHLGALAAADVMAGSIDVLHVHGVWSPDVLAAARAARRRGVPYCWQPHGMLLGHALGQKALKKRVFMAMGMSGALREAAAYLFCTGGEREHTVLPRGSDAGRGRVVFLPVSVPEEEGEVARYRAEGRARYGVEGDAPVLAFMGRIHPVKRLELTLRAFAAAGGMGEGGLPESARLVLFGSGEGAYVESLRGLARSLGIGERVVFAGWISGEEKWRALAAGDALVLNSLHENFGYTVPEALGVRTPVIMTRDLALAADVGAASGAAPDGGFARVVEPTAEGVAAGMASVVRNPPTAAAMDAGRAWVRGTFSARAIGAELAGLYASLPRRGGGAGAAGGEGAQR